MSIYFQQLVKFYTWLYNINSSFIFSSKCTVPEPASTLGFLSPSDALTQAFLPSISHHLFVLIMLLCLLIMGTSAVALSRAEF